MCDGQADDSQNKVEKDSSLSSEKTNLTLMEVKFGLSKPKQKQIQKWSSDGKFWRMTCWKKSCWRQFTSNLWLYYCHESSRMKLFRIRSILGLTLQNLSSNWGLALTEAISGHKGSSTVRCFPFFYSSFPLVAFWSSAAMQKAWHGSEVSFSR